MWVGKNVSVTSLLLLRLTFFTQLISDYALDKLLTQDYAAYMFGKHYASMYTGSMRGKGALVFAVMGYVVANGEPDGSGGGCVELNPEVLAFLIGDKAERVEEVIREFCAVDPRSRSQEEGGKKLIKVGVYMYRIVNFKKYRDMRSRGDRMEQNREAQARWREAHPEKRERRKYPQAIFGAPKSLEEKLAEQAEELGLEPVPPGEEFSEVPVEVAVGIGT